MLALVVTWLTACQPPAASRSATGPSPQSAEFPPQDFAVAGEARCQRQPSTAGAILWAVAPGQQPLRVGKEVKILFEMYGQGRRIHILAKHTDGTRITPAWGPQEHSDWGVGFVFPEAGCWQLHATRYDQLGVTPRATPVSGDAWFVVPR